MESFASCREQMLGSEGAPMEAWFKAVAVIPRSHFDAYLRSNSTGSALSGRVGRKGGARASAGLRRCGRGSGRNGTWWEGTIRWRL